MISARLRRLPPRKPVAQTLANPFRLKTSRSTMLPEKEDFFTMNALDQDRCLLLEPQWLTLVALRHENARRNRYYNVRPYDRTRVRLPLEGNDYINASYVTFDSHTNYIACQGPTPATVAHFWAMVAHEARREGNTRAAVVMITPLVEQQITKCHKYWPDEGEIWDLSGGFDGYSQFTVELVQTEHHRSQFTVSTFKVVADGRELEVVHYYYPQWSDAKVPPSIDDLVQLADELQALRQLTETGKLTPIVHCSAGVGRTGTFIAIDQLLYGSHGSGDVVKDLVQRMRDHRMLMVQTVHQYSYLQEHRHRLQEEKKEEKKGEKKEEKKEVKKV